MTKQLEHGKTQIEYNDAPADERAALPERRFC
jgi:hypothetical protein